MPVPSEIFKAYDVRGLYGEQIDEDVAEQVGRGFARVIADLSGKPVSDLRLGLGRDMRLTAPALAARYSAGMQAEGAHVLDVGQVGTEMLYFLVGSRDLDGGLMCTASHNPAAYTGAKLVARGCDRPVRRLGHPGHPPDGAGGHARSARRRVVGGRRHQRGLPEGCDGVHRPVERQADEGRRRRRQRHGRPDGRPAAGPAAARPRQDVLDAGRPLPGPRAQPDAREEPEVHRRHGALGGRRPRHRVGRRRGPLLLHRRHRPVRRRRLPHRRARRAPPGEAAGRGHPLRRAGVARGAGHGPPRGRHAAHQPRRPRLLQDPHARRGRDLRRRGLRPLLLPRLLQRGLRHRPGAAHPREALRRGREDERAARALPLDVLHLRRDQLRGRRRPREDGAHRGAEYVRRRRSPTSTACRSTTTTGTSTSARRTPSRCCVSRWSRSSRPRTWSAGATRCSG